MEHVQSLLKTCLEEIERLLSTKTVVGDPIKLDGVTLIPLISIGFGFGGGGGSDQAGKSGAGAGTGGGGGIKPVAVVIVRGDDVRVEPLRGATANVIEKLGTAIGSAVRSPGGDSGKSA